MEVQTICTHGSVLFELAAILNEFIYIDLLATYFFKFADSYRAVWHSRELCNDA